MSFQVLPDFSLVPLLNVFELGASSDSRADEELNGLLNPGARHGGAHQTPHQGIESKKLARVT